MPERYTIELQIVQVTEMYGETIGTVASYSLDFSTENLEVLKMFCAVVLDLGERVGEQLADRKSLVE